MTVSENNLCVCGFVVFLSERNSGMFTVLFITFSGVALGYLFRKAGWVRYLAKGITYTIWLLLFFFGLQVGANEQVVVNLDSLGLKALIISVAGVLGSCIAAMCVAKLLSNSMKDFHTGSSSESQEEGSSKLQQFLGGFVVVAFFVAGAVAGLSGYIPEFLTNGDVSIYVLYLLMIQVGMSIGSDKKLKEILTGIRPNYLLLPIGTIVGTLLAVILVTPLLKGLSLKDALAVGAGFGYYSLSSVLITEIKGASVGALQAAQLGTIALMSNIMREVIVLLFSPLLYRVFGKLAPISSGGATSMDSTLPVITSVCGKEMAFVSIFHGVLVDFSVPFLVTFFASL